MALTTSFQRIAATTYTVVGNNELRLYAKYNSQNTSTKKTNVTFELRTQALSGSFYSSGNTALLKIDNVSKGTKNYDIGTVTTSSEKTIATWTFDITHNSDGTYSGTAYATANVYGNLNPSMTVSFSLPTIVTNPSLSVSYSGTFTTSGVYVTSTLTNTGGASTEIQYSTNGSTWVGWQTIVGDGSISYALPAYLLSSFSTSYTAKVYFRATNSNGTSTTQTLSIPIDPSIKPSITSVTINPINTITVLSNNNLFVKTLTKPQIVTNASAYPNGGATLSKYDLTALGGYNSSVSQNNIGASYTYNTEFQKSGNYTATVKVTDTRGENSAVSKTSNAITVIDYFTPSITSMSVKRCTSNGTLSDTGTYCKLSVTYKIAPITSGSTSYNTKSLKYKIGSGSWTTISISSYNTTITQVIGGSLSTNSSYQISVQLQDLTTTVTQTTTLPTSFVLVSKRAGGKGIAFGKIAEQDNMTIDLDVVFNKTINEINVASWLVYYKNRQPHRAYTSTNNGVGWYRILRLPATASYNYAGILFSITGYNSGNDNYGVQAIATFSVYNNSAYRAKILCGDILTSDLGYIKNSNNTIDIYIYLRTAYRAIIVTPINLFRTTVTTEANEWDVWNSTYPEVVSSTPTLTGTFTYTTHS